MDEIWRQGTLHHKYIQLDAFQPGHIQVLGSLDAKGNTDAKQDALSSWACSENGCPDDENSYRIDIQGESYLGYPDNT